MTQIEIAGNGNWWLGESLISNEIFRTKGALAAQDVLPISRSTGDAVGGALLADVTNNTVHALIEPDVKIATGADGTLDVDATETILRVALAQSASLAGEGSNEPTVGFSGSGVIAVHESDTRAGLVSDADHGVTVTGGDVNVNALSNLTHVAVAGSLSLGGNGSSSSVGISVVANVIVRDTEAFIGNPEADEDAIGASTFDVGALSVGARNDDGVYAFAIAGSVRTESKPKPDETSEDTTVEEIPDTPDTGDVIPADLLEEQDDEEQQPGIGDKKTGVGFAGSVSVNVIVETTRAYISDLGTFNAGRVAIEAVGSTDLISATGGAAISVAGSNSENSESTSVGGALSVNVVTNTTDAFIQGTTLTSSGLDLPDSKAVSIWARREGFLFAFSIALAVDTAEESEAFAGSISVNLITDRTRALLESATLVAGGSLSIQARNTAEIVSIGGGAAFSSGKTGLGASISFNGIVNSTQAGIYGRNGNRATVVLGGGLSIEATNDNAIRAIAVSAGVKTGSSDDGLGAVAFTLAVNLIATGDGGLQAVIRNADVSAGGDISMSATEDSVIQAIAGALGIGSESNAFGIALAWNQIIVDARTAVDNATIDTQGGVSLTASSTQDDALIDAKIAAAAIGGAGSDDTAVGASLSINGVVANVRAEILNGSTISTAGGDVSVVAEDFSTILALTGGVALSTDGTSVGAAIGANFISNDVTARIDGSAVTSSGSVLVVATEAATIGSISLGAAASLGSGDPGVGFSVSVNVLNNTVTAAISGTSVVIADDNIRVLADNDAVARTIAGGIAFGGRAGVGISVVQLTVVNVTEAFVSGDARVEAKAQGGTLTDISGDERKGVSIEANSGVDLFTLAVGGAVSGENAVGGCSDPDGRRRHDSRLCRTAHRKRATRCKSRFGERRQYRGARYPQLYRRCRRARLRIVLRFRRRFRRCRA